MVRHDRAYRPAVAAACFVGGLLLGVVGLIFQPPLAFMVAIALLGVSAFRARSADQQDRDGAVPLRAVGFGMTATFVVLLAPRAIGLG
ncbi:MAG: hypothetical protein ACRDZ7_19330 [Acidimicrobiia bacterium]